MKKHVVKTPIAVATKEKRAQDRTAEEQLVSLQESHGLSCEALQAWSRERGISPSSDELESRLLR